MISFKRKLGSVDIDARMIFDSGEANLAEQMELYGDSEFAGEFVKDGYIRKRFQDECRRQHKPWPGDGHTWFRYLRFACSNGDVEALKKLLGHWQIARVEFEGSEYVLATLVKTEFPGDGMVVAMTLVRM